MAAALAAAGTGLVPGRVAAAAPTTMPYPLSHVAVTWTGSEDAVVRVRWAADGGDWQPWQTVQVDHDMTDGGDGTVYSSLLRADGAVRVDVEAVAGDARDLKVVAINATTGKRQVVPADQMSAAAAAPPTS